MPVEASASLVRRGSPESRVLFLCTGNYYRSRFAECWFNHLAGERRLGWRAFSRGLAIHQVEPGAGPISPYTLRALAQRGIQLERGARGPIALREEDLVRAQHIVALKRQEHRPLLCLKFPQWVGRVEYWDVHDVDCALPEQALPQIDRAVRGLLERLTG